MFGRHKNLICLLLFSLGLALWVEHRALWDPFAINDDVRNQAYWMNRIRMPGLYPCDLAARYFTQSSLISPVLALLYRIPSPWIDPVRFSQLLPLGLAPLATFFLFRWAGACFNQRYAFWVCFVFNLFIWMIPNLAGGLPRAFFFPLLFMFLWLKAERRWLGIQITCMMQALIYPPVFFLSLGLLLVELVVRKRPGFHGRRALIFLLLTIAASGLILLQRYVLVPPQPEFGQLVHGNRAEGMREFYRSGRVPIFQFHPPALPEGSPLEELYDCLIRMPLAELLAVGIALALFLTYQKTLAKSRLGALAVPSDLGWLVIVSIVLYGSASLLLFSLYVPERYVQYTFPLVVVFLASAVFYKIDEASRTHRLALVALALGSLLISSWFWRDDLIKIYSDQKAVLAQLARLPAHSLIAASYPIIANDIPVFAKRQVLVNREVAIPFHELYYQKMKQRLRDWLNAYYATDPKVIQQFIRKYHIDTLLISTRDYQPKTLSSLHTLYFDAFSQALIDHAVHAGQPASYLLPIIARTCGSFRSGPYVIIPEQALEQPSCWMEVKPLSPHHGSAPPR